MRVFKGSKLVGSGVCLALITALLFIPFAVNAGEDVENEDAFVSPVNLYPNVEDLAGVGAKLEQNRDRYLSERKWELGQSDANPGGAYIGWGVGEIKLSPDNVRYGQARIAAFHRAFADAKGDFTRFRQQDVTTTMAREFFYDDLPETRREIESKPYLQERASILAEKAFDLGEARLNRLLDEVDVDPGSYRSADRSQRKNILYDAIGQTATIKAVSSLSGVRILTTFEDLNAVGVLIIHNEQSERIARDFALGNIVSRRSSDVVTRTIREELAAHHEKDEDYIPVYGVRIMEDESGEKVLVAFGQWSPAITRATIRRLREARVQAAQRQARSQAVAALTDFVNSTLVLENVSQFREVEAITRITTGDRVEDVESYEIGERVEELVKQYGRAKLEGVTTIREWTANDPKTGHVIVGYIAMWSPATRDAALGRTPKEEGESTDGKVEYDDSVREAPALDHLDPTLRQ